MSSWNINKWDIQTNQKIENSTHTNCSICGQFDNAVATSNIPSASSAHDDNLKSSMYRAFTM